LRFDDENGGHPAAVFACRLLGMTQRILARRGVLLAAGMALVPASRGMAATLAATPQQTEGPFYPVSFPADRDNDLVQVRGRAAQAMGMVLHLQGRVLDANGRALPGTLVEIWQCDSHGLYDHPRQPGRERRDSAFQGYGRMLADAEGRYSFRTLKPVAYPGRTPHIHLKVATGSGSLLTSQFYVAGDPQNERDGVFRQAARSVQQRERIEMRLVPAPGLESGAVATTMDIVIA
jgi:protocatechuate 3,4-dioxygenase beta subunit